MAARSLAFGACLPHSNATQAGYIFKRSSVGTLWTGNGGIRGDV